MKTKLKPCPFCGEEQDSTTQGLLFDAGLCMGHIYFHVECAQCGARGPDGDSKEDAAEMWNKREP